MFDSAEGEMMNRRARIGWWALRRHPRELLATSVFAGRHHEAVAWTAGIGRRASRLTGLVRQTLADPTVQKETRLAVSDLSQVVQRARKLGMARVLDDRQTVKQAEQAFAHISKAVTAATAPRRRRSIIRPFTLTLGGGSLLSAAYVGWKRYTSS